MNWLTGEGGSLAGRRIEVTGELVVGRSGADVEIDDAQVSRRHAAVRLVAGVLEVEDLGSTNGTWVNEQRVSGRRELAAGDTLRVGSTVLRVITDQVVPAPAPPPPAPAPPVAAVPTPSAAPAFEQTSRRRRPATRSSIATVLAIAIIVADAIALIVYFAAR